MNATLLSLKSHASPHTTSTDRCYCTVIIAYLKYHSRTSTVVNMSNSTIDSFVNLSLSKACSSHPWLLLCYMPIFTFLLWKVWGELVSPLGKYPGPILASTCLMTYEPTISYTTLHVLEWLKRSQQGIQICGDCTMFPAEVSI